MRTPYYKSYANLSSAIDCKADDPFSASMSDNTSVSQRNCEACAIMAGVAGTAVVRPPWGAGAGTNDVTLTLAAGIPVELDFKAVASGTATAVTIFWPRKAGGY